MSTRLQQTVLVASVAGLLFTAYRIPVWCADDLVRAATDLERAPIDRAGSLPPSDSGPLGPGDAPGLRGRLLDGRGRPLQGAELVWSPLPGVLAQDLPALEPLDRELLSARSLRAITDVRGRFCFERAAPVAFRTGSPGEPRCSVVWVTHPTIVATPVFPLALPAGWAWPRDATFAHGRRWTARVLESDSRPVAGAWVVQHLDPVPASGDLARTSRLAYERISVSGLDGVVRLLPCPGPCSLYARAPDGRLATWHGEPIAGVQLSLSQPPGAPAAPD